MPSAALDDTTQWLSRPDRWDHNKGDERFADLGLARIQFSAALASAVHAGIAKDERAQIEAARRLAQDQTSDGAWRVDTAGNIGSPITYGAVLATYLARKTLHDAGAERFADGIGKADRWLRRQAVRTVLDAAAMLLAMEDGTDADAERLRHDALALIRRSQSSDGGWGPYATAPPEPFDTALVILALAHLKTAVEVGSMRERGRGFLLAAQQSDGSWMETTRPSGAESYAQRVSTTAWATLALLATRDDR